MRVPGTSTLAFGCAALATMVLLPSVFGEWVWDDHQLIVQNPRVRDFDLWHLVTHHFWEVPLAPPTSTLYYRPVVGLGHAVAWRIGDGDVLSFHLLSLFLHAACTALTASWLIRRFPDTGDGLSRGAVALATLAFALHPARVQSVAWASGSTDLWATFFILVGINLASARKGTGALAAAGAAFALAILSKEVAVVAPVLFLLDRLLIDRERPSRRVLALVIGPAAFALALRAAVVGFAGWTPGSAVADVPLRAAFTLGRYTIDTFVPVSPTVHINAPMEQLLAHERHALAATVLGFAVAAVLIAAAVYGRRREQARPWLADLAWMVLPILPVLNLIQIGQGVTVASRLLYLPLLGLTAVSARALVRIFRGRYRTVGLVVAGAAIIVGAVSSTEEIAHWQNDVTLARHVKTERPDDPAIDDNLARVLLRDGQLEEAYRVLSARLDRYGNARLGVYAEITWAYVRLVLTSDYEQAQILELRELFDDVARGGVPEATLPERHLALELTEGDRAEIMNNPTYGDFYDAWGWSHARTGSLRTAIRVFDGASPVTRDRDYGCHRRISVRALAGAWDEALALLAECEARFSSPAWPELATAIERGRALDASPNPDPIENAVARSRVMGELGSVAASRRVLEPYAGARDMRIVHAEVQAHISDARYDLAFARLDEAIATMPEARVELEAARSQVERFVASTNHRRFPPIWER